MKPFASLLMSAALAVSAVSALAADAAPAAAKPDLAKGGANYAAVCAACHAADGNSTIPANPRLAQQFPEYLAKQLHEFKSGKRVDPIMQGMAATLSDDDILNVSAWLATQKARAGFAKSQDLLALGERIYRGGVQDRSIAACAGCHSPNGAGVPSQYPRLAGQQADYTVKQLTDFRDGRRTNSVPMHDVAAKLNDQEVKALADYIAGLR